MFAGVWLAANCCYFNGTCAVRGVAAAACSGRISVSLYQSAYTVSISVTETENRGLDALFTCLLAFFCVSSGSKVFQTGSRNRIKAKARSWWKTATKTLNSLSYEMLCNLTFKIGVGLSWYSLHTDKVVL